MDSSLSCFLEPVFTRWQSWMCGAGVVRTVQTRLTVCEYRFLFLISFAAQRIQILFPISDWRHADHTFEQCVEIVGIIIAYHGCDLRCGQVAGDQPCLSKADTPPDHILNRGIPAYILKNMGKVGDAASQFIRNAFQGDIFRIVRINILFCADGKLAVGRGDAEAGFIRQAVCEQDKGAKHELCGQPFLHVSGVKLVNLFAHRFKQWE